MRRYRSRRGRSSRGGCLITILIGLGLIFTLALLTGCGSPGSGGAGGWPMDGSVTIACADVESTYNGTCDAVKTSDSRGGIEAMAVEYDAVFDSGVCNTDDTLSAEIEVANYTAGTARVYLFTDMAGVCGGHNTMMSTTFEVAALTREMVESIGSNFEVCATPGAAYYEVFIYNGAHLPLDEYSGDPSIDELMYSAKVNFTYQRP